MVTTTYSKYLKKLFMVKSYIFEYIYKHFMKAKHKITQTSFSQKQI